MTPVEEVRGTTLATTGTHRHRGEECVVCHRLFRHFGSCLPLRRRHLPSFWSHAARRSCTLRRQRVDDDWWRGLRQHEYDLRRRI